MGSYRYKAFISYSHKDHRWGGWLHRRLERYRIPKHLVDNGKSRRLKPIFRDREELSAASSLGEKIEQALAASENLIIICSPHAAKSHWVNQEVLSFKRQNRGAKIFSIIVEGEPFSGGDDECMPPALRFQLGADGELTDKPAEPLAADLRSTGDGRRLGVLKIISGMLGVGLDELVQRDMQRSRNRVTAITAGALTTVLAMGTLTGFAVSARKDAEHHSMVAQAAQKEAENRRDAAEDMIEFMITELKPELESVGRLKPLSIVGERATTYYDALPLEAHNDNALGRRARVFHLIGEIEDKYGNLDKAQEKFTAAYESTKALLARDPENPDRIFDHAQSAYWAGYLSYREGDYKSAEPFFMEYADSADHLKKLEPESVRAVQELTYAYTNLGILYYKLKNTNQAYDFYSKAISSYKLLAENHPSNFQYQLDLANAYGWLADLSFSSDNFSQSLQYRNKQLLTLDALLGSYKNNINLKFKILSAGLGKCNVLLNLDQLNEADILSHKLSKYAWTLYKLDEENKEYAVSLALTKILLAEIQFRLNRLTKSTAILNDLDDFERSFTQYNLKKLTSYQSISLRKFTLRKAIEESYAKSINSQGGNNDY